MVTFPAGEKLQSLVPNDKHPLVVKLMAEIKTLSEQEFEPEGMALVLLSSVHRVLEQVYGKGKSMYSLEGLGLVSELPRIVVAIVSDEALAQEVVDHLQPNLVMFS